ncbi:hypothetical protein [Pseudomonas mohnii]
MAIVKFRRKKNSTEEKEYRAETENTSFATTSFTTKEQLSDYYFYLNNKKEYEYSKEQIVKYGNDVVEETTRMSLVIQDVLPEKLLPHNFLHLPEKEYEAKLREISDIYAETVMKHNEYYRMLNGDQTKIEEKEITFSFSKREMQGLSLLQVKDRVESYVNEFAHNFVGYTYKERIPHIQIHAKPNGVVDCHLMLAYYDNSGKKLRSLESQIDLEEKSLTMYLIEKSGKFPWLETVITDKWLEIGKLTTPEMVPEEVELLKDILARTPTDPLATHEALIAAGVTVTPHRQGKSQLFNINVNGMKFIVDKEFDFPLYKSLSSYSSFKTFGKNNKNMDVEEASKSLMDIFDKMKGKSLEELNEELLKEGVCIKLNNNKAKKIKGISFDFGNGKTIKSSDLEFNKDDYTTSYTTYNNLSVSNEKFNRVIVDIKEHGFYKESKFGSIGDKKTEKTSYEEWRMKENESLYAFQKRMRNSKNNKALLALGQYEIPSPFSNTVYHNYNGRKKMIAQLLDDNTVRVFSDTPSALKAGLQIHHAKNRLSNAEIKAGYKHHIEISSSNLEALNKAWLQAKLLGYVPVVKIKGSENLEFTPTISTVEAYNKEIEKKKVSCRKENVIALQKYLSNVPTFYSGKADKKEKLNFTYFTALGNDVDRSAMALVYLDAFKLGVDKNVVFNPPNVHKNSRNRVTVDDLLKRYRLLLATAKAELPEEKYAAFKLQLDNDTGISGQGTPKLEKKVENKNKQAPDNKAKPFKPKT